MFISNYKLFSILFKIAKLLYIFPFKEIYQTPAIIGLKNIEIYINLLYKK